MRVPAFEAEADGTDESARLSVSTGEDPEDGIWVTSLVEGGRRFSPSGNDHSSPFSRKGPPVGNNDSFPNWWSTLLVIGLPLLEQGRPLSSTLLPFPSSSSNCNVTAIFTPSSDVTLDRKFILRTTHAVPSTQPQHEYVPRSWEFFSTGQRWIEQKSSRRR